MQNEDHANKSPDLRVRTKQYALRILYLSASLKRIRSDEVLIMRRQLIRSGTSVGAQYREASRARSVAEFVSKCESSLQELDESLYWRELLVEGRFVQAAKLAPLMTEGNELIAMLVASINTAKRRRDEQ